MGMCCTAIVMLHGILPFHERAAAPLRLFAYAVTDALLSAQSHQALCRDGTFEFLEPLGRVARIAIELVS